MYTKKSAGIRMQPYREVQHQLDIIKKTSIQNHLKLSVTENRRNKDKYLARNSSRFKFVKKNSMLELFHIDDPVYALTC